VSFYEKKTFFYASGKSIVWTTLYSFSIQGVYDVNKGLYGSKDLNKDHYKCSKQTFEKFAAPMYPVLQKFDKKATEVMNLVCHLVLAAKGDQSVFQAVMDLLLPGIKRF
jgi:hypothetical protein